MGSPRIYHWICGRYDLLILAADVNEARNRLIEHVQQTITADSRERILIITCLYGEPTFIADENYPIVIGV